MELNARQHGPDDPELPAILHLIRTSFAYMDGVIDPPSSMHNLTLQGLQKSANDTEIWSIGPPLSACVILSLTSDALYISKLSVAAKSRGQGYARQLIALAAKRARSHDRKWLELESRVELTDNHAAFASLGFHETGRSAHTGYHKPTSITFRSAVT